MSSMISAMAAAALQVATPGADNAIPVMERAVSHIVSMPLCVMIGFRYPVGFSEQAAERVISAGIAAGATREFAESWIDGAISRSVPLVMSDLDAATRQETDAEAVRALRLAFSSAQRLCLEAAASPVVGDLITAPADPDASRREIEDDMLAGYGQASWQTRAIWNRGELALALGACRHRVTAARHDEVRAIYMQAPDSERARIWYGSQYRSGLESAVDLNLTAAECGRLLTARIAAAR